MKKKKLALATAVATLTAGLSMFSSVSASAEWMGMVVLDVDTVSGDILVANPIQRSISRRDMLCVFYNMNIKSPEFAPIAEQVKYGDVIRFTGEGYLAADPAPGISDAYYDSDDGTAEIVGSVLDTSFENFGPVTVDDQTFVQITGADGTRYVFEEGADCGEVEDFMCWEYSGRYKGYEPLPCAPEVYTGPPMEYSEELANRYNKESGHPIWIRPNEDGDVNSDDIIDSADAAVILEEIALYGVGDTGRMNASENLAADVNSDGTINAQDAALILSYSAEVGSGMLEGVTLKAYANQ